MSVCNEGCYAHERDLETILDLGDHRVGSEEVEELAPPGEGQGDLAGFKASKCQPFCSIRHAAAGGRIENLLTMRTINMDISKHNSAKTML